MARLISVASTNLTTSTTWGVVDATSLSDSEAGNNQTTSSYQRSAAFTPGAITIDAILLKFRNRNTTSGTFSVSIFNETAGAIVAGTEVVINTADLPQCSATDNEGGWVQFKIAAPVLLLVATSYSTQAKDSLGSGTNIWTNGTAANWSRMLRTTTNQAPVAGDVMHVVGELTGAGTGNDISVTMDSTATTDYGAGTDGLPALTISKRGSLVYGTTAATNYYLKLSGDAILYRDATFNIGTVATPIPRDSTAVLEFDPVADGGMGLIKRSGTFTSQGLSRTSGKNVVLTKLTADAALSATSLTVADDTGWLSGDTIVIAKTNRSGGGITETKPLNINATATVLAFTAGLATARTGTSPVQGHVGLITRNVMIRSASSTIMTYVSVKSSATVDIDWTDFRYLGENATSKRGIEIETTSAGSFSMQYCTLRDVEDYGIITTSATNDNITFDDNIFYGLNNAVTNGLNCFQVAATSGTNINIRRNSFFNCNVIGTNNAVVNLNDVGVNFSNNVINDTKSGSDIFLSENGAIGTFANNEIYCSQAGRVQISGTLSGIMAGTKIWFSNGVGLFINSPSNNLVINDMVLFGNSTTNIDCRNGGKITFNNLQSNGYSGAATPNAMTINQPSFMDIVFNNCSFSQVSGNYTAHTTEIVLSTFTGGTWLFDNCLFGAATLISGNTTWITDGSTFRFNKFNQTTNNHIWYTKYGIARSTGTGLTDTTVRTSGSLGLRIAPSDATTGFQWEFDVLAKANTAVAITGFLQKNAAFATDTAKVELFLPGSTVADATQTMGNTTGSWLVFNLAASYTGSVDLYAKVRITALTTTSSAYIYVDDLYNGTNKITALDVWKNAQPSTIMFEQLGDAAAVWAVATSTLTTSGTTGYLLTKLLTVAKFLGLK